MARTKKTEVVEDTSLQAEEQKVNSEGIVKPPLTIDDFMPKGPTRFKPLWPETMQECPHWLDLVSIDSDEHFETMKWLVKNPKPADTDPIDVYYQTSWEEIAGCVVGWDETFYGPYSKERARELFKNHGFNWCRVQVEKYVKDIKNFI